MQKQFVKNLQDKDSISSVFLVTEKSMMTDKNGKAYLSLLLTDATGGINARLWEKAQEFASKFDVGDYVKVRGHVQLFQGRKQAILHEVFRADAELFNADDFIPQSNVPVDALWGELQDLMGHIQDPFIAKLTRAVLADQEISQLIKVAPAAKSIHHAYRGGLLEHVVSIAKMMKFFAGHYNFLNQDYLLFGALFHDLGKIWEISSEPGFQYTERGRLVGHMAMGCEIVDRFSADIADFPQTTKDLLKHVILGHHGKLEYGSPKEPAFLEAYFVAEIDHLDSQINSIFTFVRDEVDSGASWSRLHPKHNRYFYLDLLREKLKS